MNAERRVVLALAAGQALFQSSSVLLMTVGGLAGLALAPDPALATLPIAAAFLGTVLATVPASLLMGWIGRRPGFVLGALIGAAGGGLSAAAMLAESFVLLCLGTLLVGVYQAFAQFYRFAAAEAAGPEFRSRAISYVLAGGVVAAVAGPHLGALTKDLAPEAPYAGSYLVIAALGVIAALLLARTRLTASEVAEASDGPARPLAQVLRQPRLIAAVVGAATGAGVMVLVMTATPLSMVAHHHPVSGAAQVIQWHVLGMFVPSFFSGWLIRRFGVIRMMLSGVGLLLGHVLVAASGVEFLHFASALVLLGVGWNLLYVGGSTLLTETYRPSERAKVQALNDFLIVTVMAAGSFSAGALNARFGWLGLNLAAVPLLLGAATVILAAAAPRRRAAEAPAE